MKKRFVAPMLVSAVFLVFCTMSLPAKAVYSDYSIYQLETKQQFQTESQALQAAGKLKKDTGWQADVQAAGNAPLTYQISASGIHNEADAKTVMNDFTKQTGVGGTYSASGSKQPYVTVTSGVLSDEQQTKNLLAKLKKETGVTGGVKPRGSKQPYVQVVTPELASETNAKALIQDLTKQTGVKAAYQPVTQAAAQFRIQSGTIIGDQKAAQIQTDFQKQTGLKASLNMTAKGRSNYTVTSSDMKDAKGAGDLAKQLEKTTGIKGAVQKITQNKTVNVYNVQSGYFNGINAVKNAVGQIKTNTGISSNYQKAGTKNNYTVIMNGLTPQQLQSIQSFFKKKKWHCSASSAKKTASSSVYRITTAQITAAQADKADVFFRQQGVKMTRSAAGKTTENEYQLLSQETTDQSKIKKGLSLLKGYNLSAASKSVTKQTGTAFKITTEPLLDPLKINRSLDFFKGKKVSAASQKTGETAYTQFQIETAPLLLKEDIDRALAFLKQNKAAGTVKETGKTAYTQYTITTERISSKTVLNNSMKYFSTKKLQASYTSKSLPIYELHINNQFTGKDSASAASAKLKQLYGWTVSIVKIKNGPQIMNTNYNISLKDMVKKQMTVSPQTDAGAYASLTFINTASKTVTADVLNVRSSPEVSSGNVIGQLKKGDKVNIIGQTNGWAKISMNWRNASSDEVEQYVNPDNYTLDSKYYFQFLKLSQTAGLNASEINQKVLADKGILTGKGQAFITAANKYSINELYLVSHALLETGNGTSELANGIKYNGKTVYNMYGIGAYDSNPNYYGAQYAYNQGWFTPEAAIIGGAAFIGSSYIHNPAYEQDTLYKMRWSAAAAHQYATDIGWAYKQVNRMYSLYTLLDDYTLYYDVPVYLKG
ncbi:N-acetylglucosaminidase [Bacillus sp. ISL-51]|uniref:N-acetylglucosaminidase n=1 Tax=Bacteria TaxID=2 RepID=UPI001BEB45F5|nr:MULTISPECIES: N-acetylglucosaminidase [Bacteria]MBT2572900.1 N-acetylglucosaminidase [Bacillus sp. ISL-51]MBT2635374.1 N-acetylglucosaminidase [Bacillus sp. ISL-26]MBT2713373.1 N-acetylglucosaminidase [Pseudomonas sp. ISL-88]